MVYVAQVCSHVLALVSNPIWNKAGVGGGGVLTLVKSGSVIFKGTPNT